MTAVDSHLSPTMTAVTEPIQTFQVKFAIKGRRAIGAIREACYSLLRTQIIPIKIWPKFDRQKLTLIGPCVHVQLDKFWRCIL